MLVLYYIIILIGVFMIINSIIIIIIIIIILILSSSFKFLFENVSSTSLDGTSDHDCIRYVNQTHSECNWNG